ncbi:MAG: 6,7-dimethyl-8-ribityllumazine synthase [Schleiferiaceae bacterium]
MATEGNNLSAYDKENLPKAEAMRFGLVVSAWNENITNGLYNGAVEALKDLGASDDNIERVDVPGSFELIYGCKLLCESNQFDAVIAIGSVIQGETKHFDFVCSGVTNGIQQLNTEGDTPVIFCVLTDNNMQQAIERSGGKHGNKGVEAAVAAVQMAALREEFGK